MPFDIKTVKNLFFDTAAVRDALSEGERRALSKFGAFVRRRAKSSIRKRNKISEPGKPPSSHEGSLRRLILFAYDPARKSVVVGPVPFSRGEAPRLLEYGGTTTRGGKVLTYRARPFMGPAFKAELPKAPQMFKNAIR